MQNKTTIWVLALVLIAGAYYAGNVAGKHEGLKGESIDTQSNGALTMKYDPSMSLEETAAAEGGKLYTIPADAWKSLMNFSNDRTAFISQLVKALPPEMPSALSSINSATPPPINPPPQIQCGGLYVYACHTVNWLGYTSTTTTIYYAQCWHGSTWSGSSFTCTAVNALAVSGGSNTTTK